MSKTPWVVLSHLVTKQLLRPSALSCSSPRRKRWLARSRCSSGSEAGPSGSQVGYTWINQVIPDPGPPRNAYRSDFPDRAGLITFRSGMSKRKTCIDRAESTGQWMEQMRSSAEKYGWLRSGSRHGVGGLDRGRAPGIHTEQSSRTSSRG